MRQEQTGQDMKFVIIIPFVIASVFWNSGASCCLAREKASGELKLEGEYVQRLVLKRKDGHTETFENPDKSVELPAGEYRLQDVYLKDGFTSNSLRTSTYKWVTVTEAEPAILKVGAPLKQTIKIERQGPILVLSYNLTGVGGETYGSLRSKQPAFTVYKGERKIVSDKFEFG